MSTIATYDPEKQTFPLTGRQWSNSYPVSELDYGLGFYRQMRDEHPKACNNYDGWIEELERLKAGLGDTWLSPD